MNPQCDHARWSGGRCTRVAFPGQGTCPQHTVIELPGERNGDGSLAIRSQLAVWDADYNRHAGQPRHDERTTTP